MSDDLVCPDCGGFIGLEPGDARQACGCFAPPPQRVAPPVTLNPAVARIMNSARAKTASVEIDASDADAMGSTVGHPAGDVNSAPPSTKSEKRTSEKSCRKCGKDLTGKKRLKDSLGYICPDCVKAEKTVDETGRVACPECDRKIKPAGFVPYNGKFICRKCFADHMDLDKYKTPAPGALGFKAEQKQSLKRLLMLGGVLLLLMVWSAYKTFFAHQ